MRPNRKAWMRLLCTSLTQFPLKQKPQDILMLILFQKLMKIIKWKFLYQKKTFKLLKKFLKMFYELSLKHAKAP